jgi:hypothetical protein
VRLYARKCGSHKIGCWRPENERRHKGWAA